MMPRPRNVVRSAAPRALFLRLVESVSTLPSPLHEPRATLRWLGSVARRRYVMIAAVIAAGVICVVVGDATLERAFSGKSKTEKFTGIFGAKSHGEKRRDTVSRVLHIIVWSAALGVIATRFLLDAPGDGSPLSAARESVRPSTEAGRVADRFEIVARLGRGATGAVYEAHDLVLDRPIALKELSLAMTDDDTRERFRREARILARLNHPGIVQVYDFIEHEDRVWIAMELVRGGDLTTLMRNNEPMAPRVVVSLGVQMANALAFAHECDVIHRDLKPLNILLVDDKTPKITDFGLAKFTEGTVHTIEGTILGSPHYMSPEQADGRPVEFRSDIYSLGAVFYHMLCGKPPFEGQLASVLMQHLRRPPVPPGEVVDGIPVQLERVVLQALSKNPDKRTPDMSTLARQLGACAECVAAPQ